MYTDSLLSLAVIPLLSKSTPDHSVPAPIQLKVAGENTRVRARCLASRHIYRTKFLVGPFVLSGDLTLFISLSSPSLSLFQGTSTFSSLTSNPTTTASCPLTVDNLAHYFTEKIEAIRRYFHRLPHHISPPSDMRTRTPPPCLLLQITFPLLSRADPSAYPLEPTPDLLQITPVVLPSLPLHQVFRSLLDLVLQPLDTLLLLSSIKT